MPSLENEFAPTYTVRTMPKIWIVLGLIVLTFAAFPSPADTMRHYEYVFQGSSLFIYDMDNGFGLIKTVAIPTGGNPRGAIASAATGMLYVSYGPDGNSGNGSMFKYDLANDVVLWNKTYSFGVDSMSISPDGSTIYMPVGEVASSGIWEIIDASSGDVTGSIDSGGVGPHNTVLNAAGTHIYMGPRGSNYLVEADTSTLGIIRRIGPITPAHGTNGVRPFTINSTETLAFITVTGLLGFQVGDVATGNILYQVPIQGFSWDGTGGETAPSHGISISPDDKELYVMDAPNSYVHVYDLTGLPGRAPVQVADIPLTGAVPGVEQGCPYDCFKEGWLHHSRDGRYVFVGDSGDVIDTSTRQPIGIMPAMGNTRIFIEVDFQGGVPVWAMPNRNSIGTGSVAPPPPPGGIAMVQSKGVEATNVTTFSTSFLSPNTAGNLIVAFVRMSTLTQHVSLADTAGNLYTDCVSQPQNGDGHQVHIFYAKNIAAVATNTVTATFSGTNSHPWMAVYEFKGLSPTDPLDQTAGASGSSATPTTPSIPVTRNANELIFAGAGLPSSFRGTVAPVAPYALSQQDTGTSRAANESTISSTTGPFAGNFALSGSANWSAALATFRPPPASPPPTGIALAQSKSAEGTAVPSVSATFPNANVAGNLILAFVRMSTTTQTVTVNDSAGNVYTDAISQGQSVDGHQVHLFYAKNINSRTANAVTATFSGTNGHPWLAVYEYGGLSTTNPLDRAAGVSGSGSTATSPTVATANSNELVFSAVGLPATFTGTAAAIAPFALAQQDTGSSRAANEAAIASATGSFSGSVALSTGTNWTAVIATFAAQ